MNPGQNRRLAHFQMDHIAVTQTKIRPSGCWISAIGCSAIWAERCRPLPTIAGRGLNFRSFIIYYPATLSRALWSLSRSHRTSPDRDSQRSPLTQTSASRRRLFTFACSRRLVHAEGLAWIVLSPWSAPRLRTRIEKLFADPNIMRAAGLFRLAIALLPVLPARHCRLRMPDITIPQPLAAALRPIQEWTAGGFRGT